MEILDLTKPEVREEYENFVKNHRAGSFMQSLRWCDVKFNWGHEAVVSRDANGNIVGSMLVLIKKVPVVGATLLYSPRGPVCDLHDEAVLADLLEGAKVLAKKYKSYQFKIDPYVLASDEEFIAMARKLGFDFVPGMADFTTIQTRNNYMLDIENKTPEELLASFHSKWRYNIRLAQRKGVECKVCGPDKIDDFYELMKVTGDRDGFIIRPKEYFVRMLKALGEEHCRLYICYYEGKPVSGAVTTQYAGKTCYVYGASDNKMRNVMPNHIMQWTMIQWAVENGGFVYDFQGIPNYQDENSPNYGVYRFKKGFNGQVVEFAGEFDYNFKPKTKKLIDFLEKTVQKLRHVQRKLTTTGRDDIAKKKAEEAKKAQAEQK